MSARPHSRLSTDLGAFLALFLVLQAMVGGLAMGARAGLEAGPSFGIDCTADRASAPASQPGSLPHSSADCCAFGCPMVGGAAATAPDLSASLPAGPGFVAPSVPAKIALAQRGELFPQHTRAPPRRV